VSITHSSPYLSALDLWRNLTPYPWLDLIDTCAQAGVLVCTPTMFLAALPDIREEAGQTLSPLQYPEEADTWHVWIAAGKPEAMRTLARLAPYPLPWITWHRRDRLVSLKWETVIRHAHDKAENASPAPAAPAADLIDGSGTRSRRG
jgi:hypothetical protein